MKIAISEFKTNSLKLLEKIQHTGEIIIVTKRGKPFAKVYPINDANLTKDLNGTLIHQSDSIFSTNQDWSVDNDNS